MINKKKSYPLKDDFSKSRILEVDGGNLIITPSSSASSLVSSVSMKNKNDQSLSSLKNKKNIICKNNTNNSSTQALEMTDQVVFNATICPTSNEGFVQPSMVMHTNSLMRSSKIGSTVLAVPSRQIQFNNASNSVVKLNKKTLGPHAQLSQNYPQDMLLMNRSPIHEKSKVDIQSEIKLNPTTKTSILKATNSSLKPNMNSSQGSVGSTFDSGAKSHPKYSIAGHLAQTILSSPQILSVNSANSNIPNPPPMKIMSPTIRSVNSLSNPVQSKTSKTSVMFAPIALPNLTASHSTRTYNRRRSNSDSFTAIKSHKRALTSSKSNVLSTSGHHTVGSANIVPLRRGKWTVEEEEYVARVIRDFNSGYLNAPAGTTLRTYLSEKLHCDPMRITKKFTGDACIGKRVFHPALRCANNADEIDKSQNELAALENRWRRRLEMQQREVSKKSIPSIPVPIHHHNRLPPAQISAFSHFLAPSRQSVVHENNFTNTLIPVTAPQGQSELTQTALWLDRSNTILSSNSTSVNVNREIKEVEKLINEVPNKNTLAAIPGLIHGRNPNDGMSINGSINNIIPSRLPISYSNEMKQIPVSHATHIVGSTGFKTKPQDSMHQHFSAPLPMYEQHDSHQHNSKKQKRSLSVDSVPSITIYSGSSSNKTSGPDTSTSGEEDAETLVRFFNSVRQESYNASTHLQNENRVT